MYMNFSIFTVFLKNRNIIFKMKTSKVTDYAALREVPFMKREALVIITAHLSSHPLRCVTALRYIHLTDQDFIKKDVSYLS